jgi:hypothetical protein
MYVVLERALLFVGDRIMFHNNRDLCINRNNHHKPTFHPLGDFLNPALAEGTYIPQPFCEILDSSDFVVM